MFSFEDLTFYLTSFFLLCIAVIIYRFIVEPIMLLRFYKKQGLSTYFFPLVGQLKLMGEDEVEHGDIYYHQKKKNLEEPRPRAWAINIKYYIHVYLKDPELIKNYYVFQDRYYVKLDEPVSFLKDLAGEGIIFSEGNVWKRHRKLTSAAFNYGFLKEMIPDLVNVADEHFENLKKKGLDNVDMLAEAQEMTGEIVGRLFFGEDLWKYKYNGQSLTKAIADILSMGTIMGGSLAVLILGAKICGHNIVPEQRRLIERTKGFKQTMKKIIFEKMAEEEKAAANGEMKKKRLDFIEIFNQQMKRDPKEGLTVDEIVDECINYFQAGTDGPAHVLNMATYFFLVNPQCHKKIFKEINEFFSDPSQVTLESLGQMNYMTAFMKESMRMGPPAAVLFPRVAIVDHNLGGLQIKKGTCVNIPFISNNFDPMYHQEPEKFMPERWLDEDSRTRKSVLEFPTIFTPFAGGSRTCIGQHLGMNELKVIFSTLLKKYEYSLVNPNYELRMSERALYEPLVPLVYRFKEKH